MKYLICLCAFLISSAALGDPIHYTIDKPASDVGFVYSLDGTEHRGSFKDYSAKIEIDFDNIANSKVDVVLNTTTAVAGFAFATEAIRSGNMLDAKSFPNIVYKSSKVTGGGNSATIEGHVTIKGIRRPLTLTAELFRSATSEVGERDSLKLRVKSALNRFDFGVSGYPKLVGPTLQISMNAKIQKQN